ncbi:MAG TPA: DUF3536 domain-containing protein [Candidatus Binatia bacterium]
MERYLCIHGHFYQPPRENPWLEAIELQDSAYPYHDWNARITAECYAPNSVARILDDKDFIVKLVNNYAKISFNFGPTLLSWLQQEAPDVYSAILAADRESQKQFSGHGSALAQIYNHVIMPLANQRDRMTQVRWALGDFEARFQRKAEGMWLAEAAVDLATLELLAAHDIRFTILAPHQAARLRPIGAVDWQELHHQPIDPSRAYLQNLPSGRSIALFFYDGAGARSVAFEGVLSNGEEFIAKLMGGFNEKRDWPQLMHVATDGESYGHHHRFGDMALAYALEQIDKNQLARLTNYGEFLAIHPPTHEVEIVEKSSWSCAHGIDRWWSDCGCNSGGKPGWNQRWRTPLRDTFDWLRDEVALPWQKIAGELFKDPWAARDGYVKIVLDRSAPNLEQFFARHATHTLDHDEQQVALKLLELQRHALLMYTSCGWFFDDLSGIETLQVIQFAARALLLAEELFGIALEETFLDRLARAESNLTELGNGREVYEKYVRPARVDWGRVGAHYAVSSIFEEYPALTNIYCYRAEQKTFKTFDAGKTKLAIGLVRLTSQITLESVDLGFGVLSMGDHNISGGVRPVLDDTTEEYLARELTEPFLNADFTEVLRLMDRRFGSANYSLRSLFRDEQRKLLERILAVALGETESMYRQVYDQRAPLMRFMTSLHMPLPKAFAAAAECVLNNNLCRVLAEQGIDVTRVSKLVAAAKTEGVTLDHTTLEFTYRETLERLSSRFAGDPSLAALQTLNNGASVLQHLPFSVNLWKIQNNCYRMLHSIYPVIRQTSQTVGDSGDLWLKEFAELAERLKIKIA